MVDICYETKNLELIEKALRTFEVMGKKPNKFDGYLADAGISKFCVLVAQLDPALFTRILKLLISLTPEIKQDSK